MKVPNTFRRAVRQGWHPVKIKIGNKARSLHNRELTPSAFAKQIKENATGGWIGSYDRGTGTMSLAFEKEQDASWATLATPVS